MLLNAAQPLLGLYGQDGGEPCQGNATEERACDTQAPARVADSPPTPRGELGTILPLRRGGECEAGRAARWPRRAWAARTRRCCAKQEPLRLHGVGSVCGLSHPSIVDPAQYGHLGMLLSFGTPGIYWNYWITCVVGVWESKLPE